MFGSNYFNKNSILRIEKGPFYFKFCILFNFQDPRFSFVFRLTFLCASVKVLDYSNSASLLCQELFSCFSDFFSLYLKVIPISKEKPCLSARSGLKRARGEHNIRYSVFGCSKYIFFMLIYFSLGTRRSTQEAEGEALLKL